jgi:hypothetical protein
MESRKERRQRKRDDIRNASKKQRQVMEIWDDLDVLKGIRAIAGRRWKPNLIDQIHAAERRVWRHNQVRKLRREFHCTVGTYAQKYAVTLARSVWILESLDPKIAGKILHAIRRQVQRQAKRLPRPYLVTGHIDLCDLTDDLSGVKGWAFHVHLTVVLTLDSDVDKEIGFKGGKKAIKRAFPLKPDSLGGVPKPRVTRKVFDALGWDFYQDKCLQFGGVRQRVVRLDADGKRLKARKPKLTQEKERELVGFMARSKASHFTIWVGYREYKGRLIRTACNPLKGRIRPTPPMRSL